MKITKTQLNSIIKEVIEESHKQTKRLIKENSSNSLIIAEKKIKDLWFKYRDDAEKLWDDDVDATINALLDFIEVDPEYDKLLELGFDETDIYGEIEYLVNSAL